MVQPEDPKFIENARDEAEFYASLNGNGAETLSDTRILHPNDLPIVPESPPPADSREVQYPWMGKRLGHFRQMRMLGEGVMGRVFQAKDLNLERIVAVKVLRRHIPGLAKQQRVEQFLREARTAARIEHPNVINIYEINQHEDWWYIVMEMIEGESLQRIVKTAGLLPSSRACPVIADAANGLAAAHELGIIHRDVKPSNIMITRDGRGKLTDFGLARMADPDDPAGLADHSVGTPHFMAPEVIRKAPQTPALDVYSLGATLYYALTGTPPFNAHTAQEVLEMHVNKEPPDLRQTFPGYPESLAILIRHSLEKDPARRPTAADFAVALRAEAISAAPVRADALPVRAKPSLLRSRVVWITTVAAVMVLAIIGFWPTISAWFLTENRPGDKYFQRIFPDAPQSYGTLAGSTTPQQADLTSQPPPFSWVRHNKTSNYAFVASRKGRYYYKADSREAILIPYDFFVGYASADQARADGKIPFTSSAASE